MIFAENKRLDAFRYKGEKENVYRIHIGEQFRDGDTHEYDVFATGLNRRKAMAEMIKMMADYDIPGLITGITQE